MAREREAEDESLEWAADGEETVSMGALVMAIDALVAYVELKEDGPGTLHLCDRVPDGSRGQSRLHFATAPYEVTALNGLPVWGGAGQLMLGDREIAKRDGYTRVSFIERELFLGAVAEYHRRRRGAA